MFPYVLFDLDGTLTDPKPGITQCVQYALRCMGIEEPDLDKLEPFIGPPLTDSFREFMGWIRNRRLKRWQSTGNVFRKKVYMRMRFIPE